MLQFDWLNETTLKITITGELEENDFRKLTAQINPIIILKRNLSLLIDAKAFEGWDNFKAAESHFQFVRDHHNKIRRIAVLTDQSWHHWMVLLAKSFVKPDIQVFTSNETLAAENWLKSS